MTKNLRIVLAQLNIVVGDINGNLEKHIHAAVTARDKLNADVIVFPELSLTGYPPDDLLLRQAFIQETQKALSQLTEDIHDIYCLVGHPHAHTHGLHNACSLIYNGIVVGRYAKQQLPNYGVFDECRYFTPGHSHCVVPIHDIPVGLVICEDLWTPAPARQATAHGARIILSPNASPFEADKHEQRATVISARAEDNHVPIIYVNNVGGQDELVFDGGSIVIDEKGKLAQCARFFEEQLLSVDININDTTCSVKAAPIIVPSKEERIYQALVLGVQDYVRKNNFPGVLIGLSGGIDSALTLAIAVDALGKDYVRAIIMPSQFTSDISMQDALTLAQNLGVAHEIISIEPTYNSFIETLKTSINTNESVSITEQNIQARCRAIILMALSNESGQLVLATSNRSEMAVGYCTLYGDMAGGYAVLKDVFKTEVYALATYYNKLHGTIPQRIINRPPTAELAPNQKDEDSLPPYDILDKILYYYLNKKLEIDDIIVQGFDPEIVKKTVNLVRRSEYKRRQAAIGPHINHKSFGKDWRYPITNGFKG